MTVTQPRSEMYFDEFKHQLPDIDEQETIDWIRSLDDVVDQEGETRARFLLFKLLKRARQLQVGLPPLTNTRYINTISPEQEPDFPGDEQLERRIRRLIRWNAVAMVLRGQQQIPRARRPPGHVRERRHALRGRLQLVLQGPRERRPGRPDLLPGPRRAGHLRPRVPRGPDHRGAARPLPARDAAPERPVLVPAPAAHARLLGVPDGLDGPRPDRRDLPGALQPLPPEPRPRGHVRLARLGVPRRRRDRRARGARRAHVAAREGLDNLTFVVNCNLQRLDGPVRGNGKIIQELEAVFRGSGWNVIKVIWGREWDELLARDVDGVLVEEMNATVDGEFQKFSVAGGAYIREHFFGPDPRLQQLVEHLTDDDLAKLRRGGHDYRKVFAAYKSAVEHRGAPTVILAKTVKGWTLGPGVEARNITHQAKKLSEQELRVFRDRLELPIPDDKLKDAPYYHPGPDSEEVQYLNERRRALGGPLPKRTRPRRRAARRRRRRSMPSSPPARRPPSRRRWPSPGCSGT